MQAQTREKDDRRDWLIVFLIILIGLMCILCAGGWALRLSPRWQLNSDMESRIDPDSIFLTERPTGYVEPLDPAILTQPAWFNNGLFLTPSAQFSTGTPPIIPTKPPTQTWTSVPSSTSTAVLTPSPTRTSVLIPFTPTRTSGPAPTRTNTPVVFTRTPTNTPTATSTPTPTLTPSNTPDFSADLRVTKTDNATDYFANSGRSYTVVVSNPAGPSNVTGATVTDTLPVQISAATWTCVGTGGGTCTAAGSGNISDTVDLPVGASVTYTINITIAAGATGSMTNTASVSLPAGYTDPNPGDNTATDTDTLIVSDPFPVGNIGTGKDNATTVIPPGASVTLTFGTPLVVGGHAGYDLVYYELPAGTGILMDHVIIQVSDGYNWYTIFNWGNNVADTNSNLNINVIGGTETDNRDFSAPPASDILYNSTGVLIDLDGVVPNGTYYYIRIISPPGDSGDGAEVDGIEILP